MPTRFVFVFFWGANSAFPRNELGEKKKTGMTEGGRNIFIMKPGQKKKKYSAGSFSALCVPLLKRKARAGRARSWALRLVRVFLDRFSSLRVSVGGVALSARVR